MFGNMGREVIYQLKMVIYPLKIVIYHGVILEWEYHLMMKYKRIHHDLALESWGHNGYITNGINGCGGIMGISLGKLSYGYTRIMEYINDS